MDELYEIIFKVAIEKVEPPPNELSGLKDAEALSALFRAAEEKLIEKIQGEIKRSKDGADD